MHYHSRLLFLIASVFASLLFEGAIHPANAQNLFAGIQSNYAYNTEPVFVAAQDFNKDGKPDFLAITDSGIVLFLGRGDGTFTQQTAYFGYVDTPTGVTLGDLNKDGLLDIILCYGLGGGVDVLKGKADFTFEYVGNFAAGEYFTPLQGVALGDFNGDGKLDVVAGSPNENLFYLYIGKGDGTLNTPTGIVMGLQPVALVAADFNGDGKLDIATANNGSNNVSVRFGRGNGTFLTRTNYDAGYAPTSLHLGDFNQDGKQDLLTTNTSGGVSVLPGQAGGTFGAGLGSYAGGQPGNAVQADFNGDGKIDLLLYGDYYAPSILFGKGDGFFLLPIGVFGAGEYPGAASADFDGDGRADLAIASPGDYTTFTLRGKGDGTFYHASYFPLETGPIALLLTDVNHDQKLDLILANSYSADKTLSVALGNGDGTFQKPTNYAVGYTPQALATADFNGDGHPDLVIGDSEEYNGIVVLLGKGDGKFEFAFRQEEVAFGLAVGDLNGDGKPDIAVAGSSTSVILLMGKGDGTFTRKETDHFIATYLQAVSIADLNHDGKQDIVFAGQADFNGKMLLGVLPGKGNGTFPSAILTSAYFYPISLRIADINEDGHLDVALFDGGNSYATMTYLGNGDGTLDESGGFYANYQIYSGAFADVTGDGILDTIISNDRSDSPGVINVNRGKGGGLFERQIEYVFLQYPGPFAVGDLNGDGRLDILGTTGGYAAILFQMPRIINITGKVTLEGCPDSTGVAVSIALRPAGGGTPVDYAVTLGAEGTFQLKDIPFGKYQLAVKGAKWLRKTLPLDATVGDVSGLLVTLLPGDANNDNAVNIFDLAILANDFNSLPSDPNWNGGRADFNCDNAVDIFDLAVLAEVFNTDGDS